MLVIYYAFRNHPLKALHGPPITDQQVTLYCLLALCDELSQSSVLPVLLSWTWYVASQIMILLFRLEVSVQVAYHEW